MIFLYLPLGLALPTVTGWYLLTLLEWRTPVLTKQERGIYGCALGITATMFVLFCANVFAGVPFNLLGFGAVEGALAIVTAGAALLLDRRERGVVREPPRFPHAGAPSRAAMVLVAVLLVWTGIKLVAGGFDLVTTPPFFDDTINNWNTRGKVFYEAHTLSLRLLGQREDEPPGGVSSYPPTVPLAKTSLAAFAREWNDGLVDALHLVWFAAALGIVWTTLRRMASGTWAWIGVYVLAALPLELIHGTSAYADVFLSAHAAAALSLLFLAVRAPDAPSRLSFLRLAAFATALLPFTKNEGLLLHLPPILLLTIGVLVWMTRTRRLTTREALTSVAWFTGLLLLVTVPWVGFKWANGLTFGNAKGVTGLALGWQKGVLFAVFVNTFFEGNWLLFFPGFLLLLLARWRAAFRTPVVLFTAFFFCLWLGQLPIYLFTPLSTEALMQTGYARGLIQLMPVAVILGVALLHDLWARE